MAATPTRTFSDLARAGLAIEVTCQKCGHRAEVDGSAASLRDKAIAGRRYRCAQPGCGGVGLPEIGRQRHWPDRLSEHVRSLRPPAGLTKGSKG
jgi:hypothetical protein